MFLDKFRNRYSFNLLAICGITSFLIVIAVLLFLFAQRNNGIPFLGILLLHTELAVIEIFTIFLAFLIYIFEEIFNKKITNKKFLKSKNILILQNLGISYFVFTLIAGITLGAIFAIQF